MMIKAMSCAPQVIAKMTDGAVEVSKEQCQNGKDRMSARDLVLDCALPAEPGESRKAMLLRAARQAGIGYARMFSFFYGRGNPPEEARQKLEAEARRIKRAWLDLALDQRLSEMAAERERLIKQREAMDRKISAIDGALAYGRRAEDR